MNRWTDGKMVGWTNRQTDRCTDDGCMGGHADGQTDKVTCRVAYDATENSPFSGNPALLLLNRFITFPNKLWFLCKK